MADPIDSDDLKPNRGSVTINGKHATSIDYVRHDGALDLTFRNGEEAIETVSDVRDTDQTLALVGTWNAMRINRSEADRGTLRGNELHRHETTRFRDGSAAAIPWPDQDQTPVMASIQEQNTETLAKMKGASRTPPVEQAPPEPNGVTLEKEREDSSAAELRRRETVLAEVQSQFRIVGNRYRFKDGEQALAFTDRGTTLATASNDTRAARAIAAVADAKGWDAIKLSGHEAFRREVWLEAQARGIEARGYKPTEQDIAEADKRAAGRQPNRVERESAPEREAAATENPEPSERRKPLAVAGTLVEHGPAPYRHDPSENPSYRVKLDTEQGEREVWGVDLKRAVNESKAQEGDVVELKRGGKEPASVDANVRDEQGRVVGTERISTNRNAWEMRVTERRQVLDAVADAVADRHGKTPQARDALRTGLQRKIDQSERTGELPAVGLYDHNAPSRAPERATQAPKRERTQELAR